MARHRNPVFKPLVKFSIYTAFCLLLLFVLAARVGNLTSPTHHRNYFYAQLSDAESLVSKDDVKIAGVTVGQVHSVKVKQGKAIVKFSLDRNIHLRSDAAAGMRWQNIIGAKFLYIYPSDQGTVLKPGSSLTHEVAGADVANFLIDLGGFLKALNPADVNAFNRAIVQSLQGNQDQVSSLIDNTATVSQTLGGLDTNIAHIIDNLNGVLTTLEARDNDLASVIDHLSSVASDLATRNDVIDNVIANLTTVNGDLSQLVDRNGTNVDQIAANLKTVADVLAAHGAQLNTDLTTSSAGFAPYIQISKLGQWFAIRVVYTCLANQASCSYEQAGSPPATLNNPPEPVPASSTAAASGARPIGPPAPKPGIGNIVGFALLGNASQ